jgi:LysM domain
MVREGIEMGVTTQKNRTGQGGVRLTRRGRIVVIVGMALLTLAVLWLGAQHGAGAADDSGVRTVGHSLPTVVVGPHDTLWGIAVSARPGVDPRITVQRLIDLNDLSGGIVQPGEKLILPSK